MRKPEQAFWYFMPDDLPPSNTCWDWTGARDGNGYGHFWWDGAYIAAHRMSHEIFIGPIPAGLNILHRCDRKICVQPAHLYAGTQLENARDAMERGQYSPPQPRPGCLNGRAKLTDLEVSIIKTSNASGRQLARSFGVNPTTIYDIRNGRRWAHVE